jgi:hypothetical protein
MDDLLDSLRRPLWLSALVLSLAAATLSSPQ